MGINKIVLNTDEGDHVLVDLTGDSVAPETTFAGAKGHGADGEPFTGTFTIDSELATQDNLIAQIQSALLGKAVGGAEIELCNINVSSTIEEDVWFTGTYYNDIENKITSFVINVGPHTNTLLSYCPLRYTYLLLQVDSNATVGVSGNDDENEFKMRGPFNRLMLYGTDITISIS